MSRDGDRRAMALPGALEGALRKAHDGIAGLDISRTALPPRVRAQAQLSVLDISEYFAENGGGVRTYLSQKARYVESRADLRQALVVPGDRDAIGTTDGVRCYQLHGPLIPMQNTYRFLLATESISRIVAHERPDIIEVGSAYFVPWLVHRATRDLDVPAVWFYHSNIPRILSPRPQRDALGRRVMGRVGWWYVRRLSRLVRTTICASEFVQRDLEAHGVEHIRRVPLGVDVQLFRPERRALAEEVRRRLGVGDRPLALYVGRFSLEKDIDVVLDAWKEIHRRTGAMIAFIGTGPDEHLITAREGEDGIIRRPFEKDRVALANYYAAADMLVCSGPTETFGLAALEALASGTPVLACNEGGVAETIGKSGAGRLFESGERGSFIEEAVRLLQSDHEALGAIGRAWCEHEHTWDHVFDRMFDVYRDVLAAA